MDSPLVRLMMPMNASWTGAEIFSVWVMWAVMMAAMMLPSATPMILVHRQIAKKRGGPWDSVVFVLAYLLVWSAFSATATIGQWSLQSIGWLSPMLVLSGDLIPATVMILAGVFQWTPLKDVCLRHCRTPAGFFLTDWRSGGIGALKMGTKHGAFCVGCCWALMALLFVFGVMNPMAIVFLATLVAAEKLLPQGNILARVGGVGLVSWGLYLIVV